MEGRFAKGMLFDWLIADDQTGRWYRDIRCRDMLATGSFEHAVLYRGLSNPERVLAIYETERWDMEDLPDELRTDHEPRWSSLGRADPAMQRTELELVRRCGPPCPPELSGFVSPRTGRSTTSALAVVRCRLLDRAKEKAMHRWYNLCRLPAQVEAGPIATGYRYAGAFRRPNGERSFVALYEADATAPNTTEALLDDRTGVPDYVELGETKLFRPFFSATPA